MRTIEAPNTKPNFIGAKKTEAKVGRSRWTLWRMEASKTFPQSIKVGRSRLWIESEVDAWIAARIAERDSRSAA